MIFPSLVRVLLALDTLAYSACIIDALTPDLIIPILNKADPIGLKSFLYFRDQMARLSAIIIYPIMIKKDISERGGPQESLYRIRTSSKALWPWQ
jgi:hypothetical protein